MLEQLKLGLKHMGSMLPDAMFDVAIDRERRLVTLGLNGGLDSSLLGALVVGTLPDHGVVAYRDEAAGFTQAAPPYRARIRFDGRHYGIEVVKLVLGGICVYVEPAALEWQRMAQLAAAAVLRALHEAGFDAIVSNIDWSSDQLTTHEPNGPLDVWVRPGAAGQDDLRTAQEIVDAASQELSAYVVSKYSPDDVVDKAFAAAHMAWDPLRQQAVVRRPEKAVKP